MLLKIKLLDGVNGFFSIFISLFILGGLIFGMGFNIVMGVFFMLVDVVGVI